jgi:hypothetical protein
MAGAGTGTPITPIPVTSVSLDLWFPEVVPTAIQAPNVVIRRQLADACRDFCKRTMLWTYELPAIDVVANEPEYDLVTTGAEIVGADRAKFDGKTINPVAETALDEDDTQTDMNSWRTQTTDIPERFFITFEKKIRLVYIPDADLAGGLVAWAILQPLITATDVPAFLWENFKDMIMDGAKYRLLSIQDMPWTDMKLAVGFGQSYEFQMTKAKQKKFTGFQRFKTRDIVRTHYHDF